MDEPMNNKVLVNSYFLLMEIATSPTVINIYHLLSYYFYNGQKTPHNINL